MSTREQGLYKRGKIYWLSYTKGGKQYFISTKEMDIQKTIKFKNDFLSALHSLNTITTHTINHTLDFVVAKFIEDKKRKLKGKTITDYKFLLKNILTFFTEDTLINNITKQLIRDYEKNYRLLNSCSQGLLIKELKLLKEIFNYSVENELLNKYNIFDSYKFSNYYKSYQVRDRFLTPKECENIINNANEYLKRLIIFLLETCMRIKEALNIQFTDIATDPKTNIQYLRIRKEISKSKR